jgi:hypothetical protein
MTFTFSQDVALFAVTQNVPCLGSTVRALGNNRGHSLVLVGILAGFLSQAEAVIADSYGLIVFSDCSLFDLVGSCDCMCCFVDVISWRLRSAILSYSELSLDFRMMPSKRVRFDALALDLNRFYSFGKQRSMETIEDTSNIGSSKISLRADSPGAPTTYHRVSIEQRRKSSPPRHWESFGS